MLFRSAEFGWALEFADKIAEEYMQFLFLSEIIESEHGLPPSKMVDHFWHQHILDTEKYMHDCEHVFGKFFHHYPYFGLLGPEDLELFLEAADYATQVKSQYFGTGIHQEFMSATVAESYSGCKVACKRIEVNTSWPTFCKKVDSSEDPLTFCKKSNPLNIERNFCKVNPSTEGDDAILLSDGDNVVRQLQINPVLQRPKRKDTEDWITRNLPSG